jgi:hypothetical protein
MSRRRSGFVLILVVAALTTGALAQFPDDKKNEIGILAGRSFIAGHALQGTLPPPLTFNRINFGRPISFQANYSRSLFVRNLVGASLEVPVTFQRDVDLLSGNDNVPEDYNALFVTPGVRVNLFPATLLSPWGSVGGGFGRFTTSKNGVFNVLRVPGNSKMTSVISYGFGIDVRFYKNWKLRGEVRDLNSGVPDLNVPQGRTRFHNVWVGGGIVFPF